MLFPALEEASNSEALRFGERALTYGELRGVVGHVARQLEGVARAAVWALPALETCPAVLGALAAGVPVVPINPKSGQRELEHMVSGSGPEVVMCGPEAKLPEALVELRRVDVDLGARGGCPLPQEPGDKAPAIVIYTSGTTGRPKGAVLPHRTISSNLDALAEA